ncbi:MAG: hypothetical protein D6689_19920 [Deltaproteobacteria bacterium]|nr:MAG: hypothetical protein D6689_19920 [Deltaproteobacteria bacterium]
MKIDDFESIFRSAVKPRYRFRAPDLASVAVVTDMDAAGTAALIDKVRAFLRAADPFGRATYTGIDRDAYADVPDLLAAIERVRPDLICAYRNLGRRHDLPCTLGSRLDSLTQAVDTPVLVLPPPTRANFDASLRDTRAVMVIADHITGDDRLVSWGVTLCAEGGALLLVHVEDGVVFDRYADALSKIPDIDTDVVVDRLRSKLLQMPRDYIDSVAAELAAHDVNQTITPIVDMGHVVTTYKQLVAKHEVDLLVFNTKDDLQLAMQGTAYALAVEIRDRPLLLL